MNAPRRPPVDAEAELAALARADIAEARAVAGDLRRQAAEALARAGYDPEAREDWEADDDAVAIGLILEGMDLVDECLGDLERAGTVAEARLAGAGAALLALSAVRTTRTATLLPAVDALVARNKAARGSRQGGAARAKAVAARDRRLADEFIRRQPLYRASDSALMARIGAEHGLGRSAAIEAIKRGLGASREGGEKKSSGIQGTPDST